MAIRNSEEKLPISLKNLDLNTNPGPKNKTLVSPYRSSSPSITGPPSLVSLCLGVIGMHLEEIKPCLPDISVIFPAEIKMSILAIAKRRKLIDDDFIVSLADSSWEILDISASDVSDSGLAKVAEICKSIRAVDISRCNKITSMGVSELVQHCRSLETLRCGGCPSSESTARRSWSIFKPNLSIIEGETWEELDATEIGYAGQSLRWLVWPRIDKDSLEMLSMECPRIVVNPKPSRGFNLREEVPQEALPNVALDEPFVKDIDPKMWLVRNLTSSPVTLTSNELSIAEKFRLAFAERDARLAPKRAKNARQRKRRAERDWMSSDEAKAMVLASKATRSLHKS
ncbi:hypothetical protein AALP_AA7G102900 [Arabis alpina]|uniref:RNI-like superfamily protein n=1 Tax=Arabis alpina TaxID=50452 RepID=A0A087GH53_ARAAL|nr:hypothetical protein AALP_AA7G102900 [Arabis alpina]